MSTTVTYKGNTIATLSNETKTLTTAGTWLDANIQITDTAEAGITPTGTKQINITMNGVIIENVSNYASIEITTSVTDGTWPEQTISTNGAIIQTLQPYIIYHFTSTALTSLSLAFSGTGTNEQYHFDFISPATPITLTLPSSVIMENSFTVEANTKYEIDINNNEGVFAEWTYQEEND